MEQGCLYDTSESKKPPQGRLFHSLRREALSGNALQRSNVNSTPMTTQQEFLREAATTLGLTQKELAARMGAPWRTFEKWLYPKETANNREMPPIAWALVREILEHEMLKAEHQHLNAKTSS